MSKQKLITLIDKLKTDDKQSFLKHMVELDELGVFCGENESREAFIERVEKLKESLLDFDKKIVESHGFEVEPQLTLLKENEVTEGVLIASQAQLLKQYGVHLQWVPAFYPIKDLGLLWAGCTLEYEELPYPIILLKKAFAKSERYLRIYTRSELISHEMAHAARTPLKSTRFEELFAYSLSKSLLRRILGNCFQSQIDAFVFIVPMVLICFIQFATTFSHWNMPAHFTLYAMIVGLIGPAFLLLRNGIEHYFYQKALKHLQKGLNLTREVAQKILFRCTDEEVMNIAKDSNIQLYLDTKENNLRWQMIHLKWLKRGKK